MHIYCTKIVEKEQTIRTALNEIGDYYYLAFIAVDPHVQSHGLGRYLLRGLDDLATKNTGAKGLAVFVTRQEHNTFFKSEGFRTHKALAFNKVSGELLFKPYAK